MDLSEQIIREYEADRERNPIAIHPDDIPISYDAITDEWLTHIVCKNHPGARVTDHRLDAQDDGNTNRRRIFLSYNEAGQAAGLPPSVFCKALHNLPNRLVDALVGLIDGEDSFYNIYRESLDLEAPACLHAAYDRRSFNSIVVLEDVSLKGAAFCKADTPISRERAESQLALLAKLHGRFHGRMETDPVRAGLRTWEEKFELSNRWFDLEACCTKGFRAAEQVVPARLFRRETEIWPATVKSVELHGHRPRTLTHNDTHLRNWYVMADDVMGLGDWQCICRADGGRDVAYTMSTALAVEHRRAWEKDLLRFYLDKLHQEGGPKIAFDAAWDDYRRHLFSALAWWTVTLTPSGGTVDLPPPEFQPREAALTFIGRMATAIDDLDALDSFR